MATYKGIQGFAIQNLSSDPTTFIAGQIWYNSTDQAFRVTVSGTNIPDAWATGGSMNTARRFLGGSGTQTAALAFGGDLGLPASPRFSNATEEYNGSTWTTTNVMGTARYGIASAVNGAQTAGLGFGGYIPGGNMKNTEEYNGSTWSAGGDLNTGSAYMSGAGTQTAGLGFGGFFVNGGPPFDTNTNAEEYDGSAWTVASVMSQRRYQGGGAGTQTAALSIGGEDRDTNTILAVCEQYDGTSWTSAGTMGNARNEFAAFGLQTAAVAVSGLPGSQNATELYDGTSWRSSTDINNARAYFSGCGTQAAGTVFGGGPQSSVSALTEEFETGNPAIRTITTT
jgi:hypothetical protein